MIKRLDNVKIPAGKGEDELYKLVKKRAGENSVISEY